MGVQDDVFGVEYQIETKCDQDTMDARLRGSQKGFGTMKKNYSKPERSWVK